MSSAAAADVGAFPLPRRVLREAVTGPLDAVKRHFPGRSAIVDRLAGLMGEPTDRTVPSIFIYGHSSMGKTSVVRALFETYPSELWTFVNCVECRTPRLLFDRILNTAACVRPCVENGFRSYARCENLNTMIVLLTELVRERENREGYAYKDWTRYLIFDRAERLRDMHPALVPALLKLAEMTGLNVCTVFITSVVWEKFRVKNGAYEPLLVRFPEYSKNEILDIIALDFLAAMARIPMRPVAPHSAPEEASKSSSSSEMDDDDDDDDEDDEEYRIDDAFFRSFADVVYDVFVPFCRDVNELRYIVGLLFPKYVEPVQQRKVYASEKSKLFQHVQGYIRAVMDKIYLREISSAELMGESDPTETGPALTRAVDRAQYLNLPRYTKFILVASFLASYNPPRLDVRYFAKAGASERRKYTRKGKGRPAAEMNTGGKNRQQLRGPKAFLLERMLAIFYSILEEPVESTVDVQMQVSTLISLRLLTRTTPYDRLNSAKCKCNVSYNLAKQVAKDLRFDMASGSPGFKASITTSQISRTSGT